MNTGPASHVEQLFAEAIELPADQRAAYVVTHAESPDAGAEVMALIEAHDGHGRFDSIAAWLDGEVGSGPPVSTEPLLSRLGSGLGERYRIEREIGRGGMAIVFQAEDLEAHRPVALKVLRPSLALGVGPARFRREITIASRLRHPHILPLLDSGEAAGLLYYVMPYIEGESLRDRLRREGRLELAPALEIVGDVAAALGYAHQHDVIHRDIKPGNILLQERHAVVTDFGVARALGDGRGRLTRTGVSLGTPAYMSPEQVEGGRDLDGRTDIYSLACVTYEMLTGQPPFTGESVGEILDMHRTARRPRLRSQRPGIPRRVDAAIRRALARTPAKRFATAAEFVDALGAG